MEERRLLLAVALSFLVLTGYRLLYPPAPSPDIPPQTQVPVPPTNVEAAKAAPPAPVATATPAPVKASVVHLADDQERRVEIVAPEATIAFTNRGARLLSWRLASFRDSRGSPEEMVQTVPGGPRPLDIETGDPTLDALLREALFKASEETVTLSAGGSGTVRMSYAEGDLEADKELTLEAPGYMARVSVSVRRGGRELAKKVLWGPGVGNPSPTEKEVQGYQPPHGVLLAGTTVERVPATSIGSVRAVPEARWLGVESHYFAALWIPPTGRGAGELRGFALPAVEGGKPDFEPIAGVDLGTSDQAAQLYVGPKDHARLSRLGHDLAKVVPVGDWIGPIVVPLMALLQWIQGHVGNYGWSIVVLTLLINLAMSPLRHFSIANGIKMAKLSPEMRVIQDRYRKIPALDPRRQEMQKEIGALYERHGMNMGSQMALGCLPILLTMPFLIALYRVLQVAIELRGAPFLWISDLSQKDPLFLTPVLMGVSMFIMQRMTPSGMDPAQQRMMMVMPVVLTVMFFAAPAGLNLYWLSSNLCSMIQQGVTMKIVRAGEGSGKAKDKENKRR